MTLVDFEIMHACGNRSFQPQWWNLKAWAYKYLVPCPKKPMIYPYNPDQVNAASYDVCIGDRIKVAKGVEYTTMVFYIGDLLCEMKVPMAPTKWIDVDLSNGFKYWIQDDDFIITETDNFFNIPRNVSAQFALKSSRGREGYEHLSAGFIDPAWHGSKLTLELFNANSNPIPIYKGLRIGQIIFTRTSAHPIKAYDVRGRYNGDKSVQESKG